MRWTKTAAFNKMYISHRAHFLYVTICFHDNHHQELGLYPVTPLQFVLSIFS